MRTLLKDKKVKLTVLGLLLIALGIGGTYAWWTASKTTKQDISMGKLRIEASVETLGEGYYEPDSTAEYDGTIKNTGTIATIVKVNNKSEIKFKYADDDFTEIVAPNYQNVPAGSVGLSFEPASGKYDGTEGVFWFHRKGSPQERYILLDPGTAVEVTNIASFSGEVMTNQYQESLIKVIGTFHATQVLDGAMKAEFGIGFKQLKGLSDTDSAQNRADRKLTELVNRN